MAKMLDGHGDMLIYGFESAPGSDRLYPRLLGILAFCVSTYVMVAITNQNLTTTVQLPPTSILTTCRSGSSRTVKEYHPMTVRTRGSDAATQIVEEGGRPNSAVMAGSFNRSTRPCNPATVTGVNVCTAVRNGGRGGSCQRRVAPAPTPGAAIRHASPVRNQPAVRSSGGSPDQPQVPPTDLRSGNHGSLASHCRTCTSTVDPLRNSIEYSAEVQQPWPISQTMPDPCPHVDLRSRPHTATLPISGGQGVCNFLPRQQIDLQRAIRR